MTSLESKVTSLPLSRKLDTAFKEKGIKPPESSFCWVKHPMEKENEHSLMQVSHDGRTNLLSENYKAIFAYLSDELLQGMLSCMPTVWNDDETTGAWVIHCEIDDGKITADRGGLIKEIRSKLLPNACAEMTLWLIENNYWA